MAGGPITATDNDFEFSSYGTPQGLRHDFANEGLNTHNITADDDGPDGKAIFRTGNIPGGGAGPVNGTEFLETGSYVFHCTIHPAEMMAVLEVNSFGSPVARPDVGVKVKSKKLEKVVKSGKLKVEVSAAEPTNAEGISLQAKKGRKTITKTTSLDLAAGNSETAKLKLKKKAAEKLVDLEKAKVKVTGEVDFGSPVKAAKKLK